MYPSFQMTPFIPFVGRKCCERRRYLKRDDDDVFGFFFWETRKFSITSNNWKKEFLLWSSQTTFPFTHFSCECWNSCALDESKIWPFFHSLRYCRARCAEAKASHNFPTSKFITHWMLTGNIWRISGDSQRRPCYMPVHNFNYLLPYSRRSNVCWWWKSEQSSSRE